MKFLCFRCEELVSVDQMELDAAGRRVCLACYLANPPQADIDGVFAEVAARVKRDYERERERGRS